MSKIEVNAVEPQCGTNLTIGASGDTITFPAGTTVVNSGTQTGFGRTGTVDWDTTPKTTTVTAVNGNGYFVNTTAGVITVNLPAGSAGNIISMSDYAATWQTNNVTVVPNGSDKIGALNQNATLNVEGQSVTFVYVDSTQGWINTMDSTSNVRGAPPFIVATGGTITTVCTDYKVHTFTGPGTFCVSSAGSPVGSDTVDYMVAAGGGGGGGPQSTNVGAGGGAGGYRESFPNPATGGLPVSVQGYSITIGGGGVGGLSGNPAVPAGLGTNGLDSIFSTITSAGGGGGGGGAPTAIPAVHTGKNGGSGGGGGGGNANPANQGSGNTPPVSPAQGTDGGIGGSAPPGTGDQRAAGGGGAGGVGQCSQSTWSGNGGTGSSSTISGSSVPRAGGGAGGYAPAQPQRATASGGGGSYADGYAGTINTGGGGGAEECGSTSGTGGSGIVIIRYKFQ